MWTREVPKTDGYYWAKEIVNERERRYGYAQVVQLVRVYGITFVNLMGTDDEGNARLFLWYDEALCFVPPPFTSDDAVRLGVTGE